MRGKRFPLPYDACGAGPGNGGGGGNTAANHSLPRRPPHNNRACDVVDADRFLYAISSWLVVAAGLRDGCARREEACMDNEHACAHFKPLQLPSGVMLGLGSGVKVRDGVR